MGFTEVFGLLALNSLVCVYILFTENMEWESVHQAEVASSNYMSTLHLGILRAVVGSVVWSLIIYLLVDSEGIKLSVLDRSGKHKLLHLKYGTRFTVFTVWCWCIQGLYFVLSTTYSLCDAFSIDLTIILGEKMNGFLTRATWVLFEVCFSTAFLVTIVVTYVLLPGVKRQGLPTTNFFKKAPLAMHNLNAVFMATELILNKMSFTKWHFPFVLLYGMSYIVFQWYWVRKTDAFYYFFLDYNRKYAFFWHLGLMIGVGLFFFLGYGATVLLEYEHHNRISMIAIGVFTVAIMKVRDSDLAIEKAH